ncbi:MAG TPA: ankyrin repeat domain-containing protein [Bacteriovoracaceae bacterium]|nr:ankyrin repeat domain-containing protein [Bacteriovoracaceae bacterium]
MSSKLLILALFIGLCCSCGKKAEESGHSNKKSLTYSEAEINFYLFNEIRRCVEADDTVCLKRVLQYKKDIKLNELGYDGETLLTKALSMGHVSTAKLLIQEGADIHVSNINNETPLIIAVNKKLEGIVKELVQLKADLNKKDIFGDTALILAIKHKNENLALFLIEKGADIMIDDRYSRSPYNLSTLYKLDTVSETIKSLLEQKFGEPDIEEFKNQILHDEFKRIVRTVSRFNHLVVQYEEINPLSLLALRGNEDESIEGAKIFMRWGAKVDGPETPYSNPPLIEAMINLKFEYAEYLIDKKADLNKLSIEGLPPLQYAIELNEPSLVESLYSRGAKKRFDVFDACSIAKKIADDFSTSSDKQKNKQIRKILGCSFFGWF